MSDKVSNLGGSPQKQEHLTEADSVAEGKIASNLTGAVPTRQLVADSKCGHVSPERIPAHESVKTPTDIRQSRRIPDTVRPSTSGREQPFVVETLGVPDTKSTNYAEVPQAIPADRQAEPCPIMTTGLSQPHTSYKACVKASRRSLASQIKHLKRRRATAIKSQTSQSGSSLSSDASNAQPEEGKQLASRRRGSRASLSSELTTNQHSVQAGHEGHDIPGQDDHAVNSSSEQEHSDRGAH